MKTKVAIVFAQPSPYRIDLVECLQNEYPEYEFCFFYGESLGTRNWEIDLSGIKHHRKVNLKWIKVKAFGDIRSIIYSSTVMQPLNDYYPDVIIASEYNAIALDALKWAKRHKKPFISWTDGTLYSERNINFAQKLQRMHVIRNAAAYIASSKKSKEVQLKYGAEEGKIWISTLTVDTKKYLIEKRKTDVPTIIFVGSLIERKGFDLLLKALSQTGNMPYKLIVAGDGVEKEHYIDLANSYGILNRIDFRGFVRAEEMRDLYARSDIFVLPTREDCFGLVLIEAMCASLPIFVSKYADGAYEVVEDGVNGYIFDPNDVECFANLLEKGITDQEMCEKMGMESRKRVEELTLSKVAVPIIKAIQSVLKGV